MTECMSLSERIMKLIIKGHKENRMDYIVRATAANGQIRAFAITSKEMVETARKHHDTSPVATAALGRLLTGGAMMGVMMKGEKDMLTLMMKGDGPINGVTVTADSKGNVKGYVGNPNVLIPANYAGKLDVGAAIGYGTLTVIKDMGLKEPYCSQVPLGTSEVAEDLTYYFASSEQVPSAVGLGVLMSKDNTVKQSGGFIVQLMPFADEEVISKLEERVNSISSVTDMLEKGMTPEDILKEVMGDMDVQFTDKITTGFACNCSKERIVKALAGISKKDMDEIINEGKEIEVKCDFCNTNYKFSVEELKTLRKQFS